MEEEATATEVQGSGPDSSPSPQRKERPNSLSPDLFKNLNPYMTAVHSPKSKSGHISTMKSLGMLHELQDYISGVEALASEHKRELERVKEEKKDIEKAIYKIEAGGDRGILDFTTTSVVDMPPKLRAVFEENTVMKTKLKKYKSKTQTMDLELTKKQHQILAMEDTIVKLKQQLEACSRTPSELETEEALKQQLETGDRRAKNLEHETRVLQQKIAIDAKLSRQAQQAASREKEALKSRLILAQGDLEEKDKELRAALLDLRRLSKRLAPVRGSAPLIGGFTQDFGLMRPPPQLQQQQPSSEESGVRVMVLVVRDDGGDASSAAVSISQPEPPPQAAPTQASSGEEETDMRPDEASTMIEGDVESHGEHIELVGGLPDVLPPDAEEQGPAAAAGEEEGRSTDDSAAAPALPSSPLPEQQQPEEAAAAAPAPAKESHTSAPRPVPYSHTAARAESKVKRQSGGAAPGSLSKHPSGKGGATALPGGTEKPSRRNSHTSSAAGDADAATASTSAVAAAEELAAAAAAAALAEDLGSGMEDVESDRGISETGSAAAAGDPGTSVEPAEQQLPEEGGAQPDGGDGEQEEPAASAAEDPGEEGAEQQQGMSDTAGGAGEEAAATPEAAEEGAPTEGEATQPEAEASPPEAGAAP